ncbi:hypothetical protein [Ferrimonas lipolytica]|uniref:Uncharacterized protein n=1 Tax=Ferrimonas lipolytica TaxID=2724191 RepID=A0A6H1UI15_9GAMM|nr:hypothetical protein [Ferrimonas lipolytica]QIZ78747.1 hypothetical protein HER31_18670 [Ferrimonas lipolytica]
MIHFSFIPLEELNSGVLNSLEDRYELEEVLTFETVGELKIFVDLLGAELAQSPFQNLQDVDSSWLINGTLKSFSEPEFELFYQKWITLTGRDNTMDEYGQLICFNSTVGKLNKETHKVVLQNAI